MKKASKGQSEINYGNRINTKMWMRIKTVFEMEMKTNIIVDEFYYQGIKMEMKEETEKRIKEY